MIDQIVLDLTPFGARAALLAGGRVRDFVFADEGPGGVVDRVYLGRVRAVDRSLDAAFVDCGLGGGAEQAALLTARDARPLVPDAPPRTPIDRLLAEGAAVVVQGIREATGGKGPRVTADIRLPGVYLLHRPRVDALEVSQRVRGPERAGLLERGRRLLPDGGFVLRAAAVGADDAAIMAEADRLRAQWGEIEERARRAGGVPRRLFDGGDSVRRILRDHVTPGLRRLTVGGRMQAALRCRSFLEAAMPELLDRVERLDGDAFELTGVAEDLEAALGTEVPLPGGGSLIVEPTAALTAIDVNAGGGGDARAVNPAAAEEVARQLRLRNIGGTVVVDFIDPRDVAERAEVERRLKRALADDPAPVRSYPMSPLGLVQISRRRRGPSLAERLARPCAACDGTGLLPSLRRRGEALLAELRGGLSPTGGPVRVRLAPDLHAYLTGPAAFALEAFGALAGRRLGIEPAPELQPGAYDIRFEG